MEQERDAEDIHEVERDHDHQRSFRTLGTPFSWTKSRSPETGRSLLQFPGWLTGFKQKSPLRFGESTATTGRRTWRLCPMSWPPDPLENASQTLPPMALSSSWPCPLFSARPSLANELSGIREIRRGIEPSWFIGDQLTRSNYGLIIGDRHR